MLNNITIMGRLTRDPELRTTQNGTPVSSFTLAVDRDYQKGVADFFNCTAWRQTGEFVNTHFSKGQLAVVNGSMQSRSWTDKNGNKRLEWEVNVENVYFGEKKQATASPTADVSAADFEELPDDEELPV